MIRRSGLFFLAIVAMLSVATVNSHAQSAMTHHVREATRNGKANSVGRLSATQVLQLNIVLPLRDQAGLNSLLKQIYDPASPNYRHFLTVPEFTERFGPPRENYDALVRFAKANHLTVVGGTRDGMDVQVKGSVKTIEKAFHLQIHTYRHPNESRTFYGPDREPTASLAFPLWHISGLDNYSIPHALFVKRSDYAKAHNLRPEDVVTHATTGSGPSASFLGSDMRAAYYGATTLTGAGQNLGLFEYAGTDLTDLTTYFANIGQTNKVPVTLYSVDGTSTACVDSSAGGNCDDTEQTLDMTQAIGMAPGLASLVVYVGATDTAIIGAMTSHSPLPATIGCSWGWTPADASTLDPYFQRMAAQGQNFFAASGDSSTWSASNEAWPADDAYVVSVGGTDLVTAGAAGSWQSETAWTDSGGGISPDSVAIPSWQQLSGVINTGNHGSTSLRNGPDVSANADFTFYTCANQTTCQANAYGGTSFAAPMWAGYIALVNQQLVANGQPAIGFINPAIYQQNVTSSYATDFHDITSGTSGSYSAVTGYDLVTGWGSPNGTSLINALGGAPAPPTGLTATVSPASVSAAPGASVTTTVTIAVSQGFNLPVDLSATGEPTGVTASFNPAIIAAPGSGTSALTLAVDATTPAGTYPVTVTAEAGSITQTATVSLTVTASSSPAGFAVSASPASLTVARRSSGTSTITTSVSGSFNSAITLAASGAASGETVTFNPRSIAAPGGGNSTLTVKASKRASIGNHTITVTAKGGDITQTTPITVDITR